MRISTFDKKYQFLTAVVAMLFGTSAASASEHPTVRELLGRYTLNGEISHMEESVEDGRIEPAAANGYSMVIIPGETDNTVKVLGFFGYGGGFDATYDETTGKLTCTSPAFYVNGSMSGMTNQGLMVAVDLSSGAELVYSVAKDGDNIVITAQNDLVASALIFSGDMNMSQDKWTYAAGYTLTKNNIDIPVSVAAGVYDFEGDNLVDTMADVDEFFTLTITASGDNKVGVSGLFGLADEIPAYYQADGGVVVLPADYTFSNGYFTGSNMDDYGIVRYEAAPYLLVEDNGLVSPSTFTIYGDYDEVFDTLLPFTFVGGKATRNTNGIATVATGKRFGIKTAPQTITVDAVAGETVCLYDGSGALKARTNSGVARFEGLSAGIYIVKVGDRAEKVVVK